MGVCKGLSKLRLNFNPGVGKFNPRLALIGFRKNRVQVARQQPLNYPRYLLRNENAMVIPEDITDEEEKVLDNLMVDKNKVNEIERETQQQADKWKEERSYRFTASRFHLTRKRRRNHDTFAQKLMHTKHFTSKYVEHGKKYEPVAVLEYQKFMASRKNSSPSVTLWVCHSKQPSSSGSFPRCQDCGHRVYQLFWPGRG